MSDSPAVDPSDAAAAEIRKLRHLIEGLVIGAVLLVVFVVGGYLIKQKADSDSRQKMDSVISAIQ